MESTHFSSNAENRPFGALQARFPSWPRKRPFFTRVLRHVLAQIQRIGQSELQKRDFRAGPGHMKSTRLGTNVKDRQNAENRPSELRKRDFRAGAPTARFSSWPRKRSLLEFICNRRISAQRRESATRSSESETFVSGRSLLELSMKCSQAGPCSSS